MKASALLELQSLTHAQVNLMWLVGAACLLGVLFAIVFGALEKPIKP